MMETDPIDPIELDSIGSIEKIDNSRSRMEKQCKTFTMVATVSRRTIDSSHRCVDANWDDEDDTLFIRW